MTLLDGAVPVSGPQTIFGASQEAEEFAALLAENELPASVAEFTFILALVNTGDHLILFDTGNGEGVRPERGLMSQGLAASGDRVAPGVEPRPPSGTCPDTCSGTPRVTNTTNHFVLSLRRRRRKVRLDMDTEAAAASRKEVFGIVAVDSIPRIGYRMPFPGVGHLTARCEDFRSEPASLRINV